MSGGRCSPHLGTGLGLETGSTIEPLTGTAGRDCQGLADRLHLLPIQAADVMGELLTFDRLDMIKAVEVPDPFGERRAKGGPKTVDRISRSG